MRIRVVSWLSQVCRQLSPTLWFEGTQHSVAYLIAHLTVLASTLCHYVLGDTVLTHGWSNKICVP